MPILDNLTTFHQIGASITDDERDAVIAAFLRAHIAQFDTFLDANNLSEQFLNPILNWAISHTKTSKDFASRLTRLHQQIEPSFSFPENSPEASAYQNIIRKSQKLKSQNDQKTLSWQATK